MVADVADQILVMYGGRTFEQAPVMEAYARPANPYTLGLLQSIPTITKRLDRLLAIPGVPPSPLRLPPGCPYGPRCSRAHDKCRVEPAPPLVEVAPGHLSACWFAEEVYEHGLER